jgi:polyisoprenoid-binding protein YceI
MTEDGTASVAAEIDVTSVRSGSEQRDEHIKGEAIFDVDNFPTASFASTGVRADGDSYMLDGEFTLKGITKPVSVALGFSSVHPGMGPRRGRRISRRRWYSTARTSASRSTCP